MVNWDAVHASHRPAEMPSEALVRFICETFDDARGLRALELGCGAGANLRYLSAKGLSVCGVDGSRVAIELSADIMRGLHHTLICGGITDLPHADDGLDCIIDIEAIYANPWPDIEKIVAEIRRVLKPGGWFFGQMMRLAYDATKPDVAFGHRFIKDELLDLFSWAEILTIDRQDRTARNGAAFLGEWLVRARKPL